MLDAISREPTIEKALLYGSRARGDAREGSDIDIALFGQNIPRIMRGRLEDSAGLYKIDVVFFDTCDNQLLKETIRRDGIEIYSKS